jgi:dipeptidase D
MKFIEASELLKPKYAELLQSLTEVSKPAAVWKYFMLCLQTPRPSGSLDAIRGALLDIAKKLELESDTDAIGNVVIRRPPSAGYESSPIVCIQAHIDMVASKNDNVAHDFKTDPIDAYIDGEWLKARDTTLGADDGIGVAACLALLEDTRDLPGMEMLFTVEEESDMSGGLNLAPAPFLKASRLINVDSEEEHSICIGCAGGFEKKITLPIAREDLKDRVGLKVKVFGLQGGHTGVDIHQGKINAIKHMGAMLNHVKIPFAIASFEAGTAKNAIPRECTAVICIKPAEVEAFTAELKAANDHFAADHVRVEPCCNLDVQTADCANPVTLVDSRKIVDLLCSLPDGVIKMSQAVEGLVEASVCQSLAGLQVSSFFTYCLFRSSAEAQMTRGSQALNSLARLCGAQASDDIAPYPGWNPEPESHALSVVKAAHEELFESAPHVYAVHAGLECGLVRQKYPDMDCVSIGPEIRGAHSPQERLLIPSVDRFYNLLTTSLIKMT